MATNLIQDALASPARKAAGPAPRFKFNRAAVPARTTSPVEGAATNMIQGRQQNPAPSTKLTGKSASAAEDQATIEKANAAALQKPATPGGSYDDEFAAWQKNVGARSQEEQGVDLEIKKEHLARQRQDRLNERGARGHVNGGGTEISAADKAKAAGSISPMMGGNRISKDASGKTVLDTGPSALDPNRTSVADQSLVAKKSAFSGKTGVTKAGSSVQIFNRAGSNVVNGRIVGSKPGRAVNTPENPNAEAAAHAQMSRASGGDGTTVGKVIDDGKQAALIADARVSTNKRNLAQHGTIAVDPRHAGPGQLTTDVARDPKTGVLANVKAKGVREGPGTPAIGGLPTKYVQGAGTGVDMAAAAANPTFAQAAPLQGASFLGTAPVSNGLEMKPTSQPLGINTPANGSTPSLTGPQNITPTMAAVNQQVAAEDQQKTVAADLKEIDRTLAASPAVPVAAPVAAPKQAPPPAVVVQPKQPRPGDAEAAAPFKAVNAPFYAAGNAAVATGSAIKNVLTGQTNFQKRGLIAGGKPKAGTDRINPNAFQPAPNTIASNNNSPEFDPNPISNPSSRVAAVTPSAVTPATDNSPEFNPNPISNPSPRVASGVPAGVVNPKPQPAKVVQTAFKPKKNNPSDET